MPRRHAVAVNGGGGAVSNLNAAIIQVILTGLLSSAFISCTGGRSFESPNFVVILIDDLGYGDIAPFGSRINATPNLDRMAAEGIRLTAFYAGAPLCPPSRAALMTGSYAKRVGLATGAYDDTLFPAAP